MHQYDTHNDNPANPVESARVTVIRAGTGAVLVDGDGATIIGAATQNMPAQYDAADLIASDTEWVLK